MSDIVITKETTQGEGLYLIEIDQDKSSKVEGETYIERINNAINDFLTPRNSSRQTGSTLIKHS